MIDRLIAVGLSNYEASAYLSLLRKSGSSPVEIATRARIPKQSVHDVLLSLQLKGFCSIQESSPRVFYATDPAVALERLREQEAEDFRRRSEFLESESQQLADSLLPVFKKGINGIDETPVIEVIKQDGTLSSRLIELAKQTSSTLDTYFGADTDIVDEDLIGSIIEIALRNELRSRIIFDARIASISLAKLWSEALAAHGSEVRILNKLPIKLSIFDESDAVIAVPPEEESASGTGVVVTHRKTVEFLKFAFDQLWVGARASVHK